MELQPSESPENNVLEHQQQCRRLRVTRSIKAICATLAILLVLFFVILSTPATFKAGTIFSVEKGESLSDIADALEAEGYIRSSVAFKVIVRGLFFTDTGAVAGEYFFEDPTNTYSIAKRIVTGDFHLTPVKLTIPEGLNKFEVAELIKEQLPDFDTEAFVVNAPEGYLFPDTYFFVPTVEPLKMIQIMQENFNKQIEPYKIDIEKTGKSLSDIIKMASIVETEARQSETRKIIAGILWNRIEINMPLQVDVSFKYINGKGTFELTEEDLNLDSLYNSYRYVGLPPTPISNPGLDSIMAVIAPTETDYFYFLSDDEGVMHYAKTFEEHKKNKLLYLR